MSVALLVLVYHGHASQVADMYQTSFRCTSARLNNVQGLIENPSLCECFTVICFSLVNPRVNAASQRCRTIRHSGHCWNLFCWMPCHLVRLENLVSLKEALTAPFEGSDVYFVTQTYRVQQRCTNQVEMEEH